MADQNPLAKLLESFLPPKADGPRVPRPLVDPHPTKGKEAFATGMDLLLGGLGLSDPLAEDATGATGLGSLLGMIGPAGAARGARGLFSRVDEAAKLIPKGGAHPSKVMSLLKNNASGEELAWRGVPEFVQGQGGRVTPEALAAHLQAKPAPMPTTQVLGGPEPGFTLHSKDGIKRGVFPTKADAEAAMTEAGEYLLPVSESRPAPKYAAYQVPGGTNYRETLSTLPEQPDLKPTEMVVQVFGAFPKQFNSVADANDYIAQITAAARQEPGLQAALNRFPLTVGENVKNHAVPHPSTYRSPHFDDTPNILVHTRSNERTLPTGEPGRLIENVQSDWHQAGRKQGYQPQSLVPSAEGLEKRRQVFQQYAPELEQINQRLLGQLSMDDVAGTPLEGMSSGALTARRDALESARDEAADKLYRIPEHDSSKVPNAPFKDSWPELGLKQEVLDAVNRDAEWIGITPAATLNTRGEAISEAFQDQRLPLTLEKILKPFGGGRVERGVVNAGRQPITHRSIEVPRVQTPWAFPPSPLQDNTDILSAVFEETPSSLGPQIASVLPPLATDVPRMNDAYRLGQDNRALQIAKEIEKQRPPATTDAFIARLTPEMRAAIKEKGLPLLMLLMGLQVGQGQPLDKGAAPVKR